MAAVSGKVKSQGNGESCPSTQKYACIKAPLLETRCLHYFCACQYISVTMSTQEEMLTFVLRVGCCLPATETCLWQDSASQLTSLVSQPTAVMVPHSSIAPHQVSIPSVPVESPSLGRAHALQPQRAKLLRKSLLKSVGLHSSKNLTF